MSPIRYFLGQQLRLQSPLQPEDIATRINKAAGSSWNPFAEGVIGKASSRSLRLARSRSPFEFNAKPILVGRITSADHGSRLDLWYGAPGLAVVFFVVWYVLLAIFGIAILRSGMERFTGILLVVFLLVPVFLQILGTMRSEKDLGDMLAFLFDETGAHP